MTETARTERAKIVAYLRRITIPAVGDRVDILAAFEILNAASAIERGDHLKKPEPSILVEDWKDVPSVGH